MARKYKSYIFKIKCGRCNDIVVTKSRWDWKRCSCCAFWVMGDTRRPIIGGPEREWARTLDDEVFFEPCRYTKCLKFAWYGQRYCNTHRVSRDEESYGYY